MKTCSEIASSLQPTIGEVALQKARNLARIAAERAITKDWTDHPMWGIAVDTDKFALAYQAELRELVAILMPRAGDLP